LPSHRVHRVVDRMLLGRECPSVHRFLDEPYKLLGSRHRILRHDLLTILALAAQDPVLGASALLHVLTDYGYSALRRRLRKSAGRGAQGWRRK